MLSSKEAAESLTKTSPLARRNWLLGRVAAKAVSSALWNMPVNEVEILRGANGKPEADFPGRAAGTRAFISISHTTGGALAAAANKPVGVDLEDKNREFSDQAWLWAFTEEERELAGRVENHAYPRRLAMWCAKEAAAKSWGLALLNHFSEVKICKADWPEKRLIVEHSGGRSKPSVVELMEAENFLLALAVSGQEAGPVGRAEILEP